MPTKKQYLSRHVKTIEVKKRSVSDLMKAMGETGFQGKQLAKAADTWEAMLKDPSVTIFMGYAGSMSTTGQWKIVKWLIEQGYIDCLVSTGANITEDIVEAMGYPYYQGSPVVDDYELSKHKINRYYDVLGYDYDYMEMEYMLIDFMKSLPADKNYSSAEYLYLFGKFQSARKIKSITEAAYRCKVPVFSPALADSEFGVAAYIMNKENGHHNIIDQMKDFEQLGAVGETCKKTSVVYIGGGVPKDTIQLVTIMLELIRGYDKRFPHSYAIQITSDSPQWGGLSGCTFEEAVSWGKIDAKATKAVVYCDATIALPLISHALLERMKGKKRKRK